MEILLTGSEGSIGHFILEALYNTYDNVKVVRIGHDDSHCNNTLGRDEIIHYGDLRNKEFVQQLFQAHKITHVIHAAARWNGYNNDFDIMYDNMMMTLNIFKYLPTNLRKFVYFSSFGVYEQSECKDELLDLRATSSYSLSKLFSEDLVKTNAHSHGYKYTIWRPSHIVSPREKYLKGTSHVVTDMMHRIIDRAEDVVLGRTVKEKRVGFTWVEDVAQCVAHSLIDDRSDNQIFNIGTSTLYTLQDLIEEIRIVASKCGLLSCDVDPHYVTVPGIYTDEFRKIKDILGWCSTTCFSECIRKCCFMKYDIGN